jgi:Mor family transcriptional regulator
MSRNENKEAIEGLFNRLCNDFGQEYGMAIVKTIIEELGGLRVTVPSWKMLYRKERNALIRKRFNGFNHKELGIMFNLSETQVRRIVNGRNGKDYIQ